MLELLMLELHQLQQQRGSGHIISWKCPGEVTSHHMDTTDNQPPMKLCAHLVNWVGNLCPSRCPGTPPAPSSRHDQWSALVRVESPELSGGTRFPAPRNKNINGALLDQALVHLVMHPVFTMTR
ncbi:Hypothetical predicted protein [Podarcis lilfordi]|uniref:Uncharacterized protein n=1 Tax=Podarcis lilfordi TaxID=74358 RepID=A0AA35LE78_9SAUR|nr:Hypothetical predicted protein [Podarcis lilfordi]